MRIETPRLVLERLTASDFAPFHRLVVDPHVRRFLLDGQSMDEEWSRAEIARSDELFDSIGLGLWLVHDGGDLVGFAGFRVFEEMAPEPQLLYAFVERVTGRGYATEVGGALVALAGPKLDPILAAADEPNAASIRVLAKLGFEPAGSLPGAFGRTLLFERRSTRDGRKPCSGSDL